jgi:hypothetical protein
MDGSAIHGRRGREPISCANRQGSDGGLNALAGGELLHFQRRVSLLSQRLVPISLELLRVVSYLH